MARVFLNKKFLLFFLLSLFLIAWFLCNNIVAALEWGPTPIYTFSPNYIMVRRTLCYIDNANTIDIEAVSIQHVLASIIPENIEAFQVENNWLIGKTSIGYFAIDMKDHSLQYPIESIGEVKKISNIKKENIEWIDEYNEKLSSPYLYRRPGVQIVKRILNLCFIVSAPILVLAFLFFSKRFQKKCS